MAQEKYKDYIGKKIPSTGKPYVVDAEKIIKFAKAVHETDEDYLSGRVAPLSFASAYYLKSFGGVFEAVKGLFKDPLKLLHAGQTYEFFDRVQPGDELLTSGRIADVYVKNNMLWIIIEGTTVNQHGNVVTRSKVTWVIRPGGF